MSLPTEIVNFRSPVKINPREDIHFQITDINETDKFDFETKSRKYQVRLIGLKNDGTPVIARVNGFQPFFYVRLPSGIHPRNCMKVLKDVMLANIRLVSKDSDKIKEFNDKLQRASKLQNSKSGIARFTMHKLEELYWFQDGKKFN